jgi:penicillin V acylase-like amidase (Ntn superfamily)
VDYYFLVADDKFFRTNNLYTDTTYFEKKTCSTQAQHLFEEIIKETEKADEYSNISTVSVLLSLFIYLNRHHASPREETQLSEQKKITLVRNTLVYLQTHFREKLTVEQVADGLKIYQNPVEVLTNNPTFDWHMANLQNYMGLSSGPVKNTFAPGVELTPCSKGMGAIGLPGDLSSASRFVRAAFVRCNSRSGQEESQSVSQFFHILGSVAQQRGCVELEGEKYEITYYSCCCNTDRGIYYYTTYENSQITAVDMHREDLEGSRVISYPLVAGQKIAYQN